MEFYSLNKLKMKDNFYDIFEKTIKMSDDVNINYFVVTDEYSGRLDMISMFLYGSTNYIEELMVINNIINPFTIKSGDIIYYPPNKGDFDYLYDKDPDTNDQKDRILNMNKNKITKKDPNRLGSPPTIKPDNLKQIDVNFDSKKIKLINKFR